MNTEIEVESLELSVEREAGLSSFSAHRGQRSTAPQLLPAARVEMRVRVATLDDIPFMDALQKKHSKQLGFFPRQQMEGYVTAGNVLIAEDAANAQPLGYVAYRDRYLKRDELGVIYQMCVTQAARGKLVAANLLKAVFDRSPRGCKLYCCWCAQDLAANKF